MNSIGAENHGWSSVNVGGTLDGFASVTAISISENGSTLGSGYGSGSTWNGSCMLRPGQHTLTISTIGQSSGNYSLTSASTTIAVNVPAGDSTPSITIENSSCTVMSYLLAWDATASGTNWQDDLDGNSSFFTNGQVLGQLHATDTTQMGSVILSGTIHGIDSGASISIQENGSTIGSGTASGPTWTASAQVSGDGEHMLTIIVNGTGTVTGDQTTATTTTKVTVTGSPPAITYSATMPSSYISVAANGVVTVTDAAGLESAAEGGGITLGVQATDGMNTVQSQFAMVCGAFGNVQSSIWMEDNKGNVFQPTTAADLLADMKEIQADHNLVNTLIIKGHGGSGAIHVGTGDDWLTCEGGVIRLQDREVTSLLQDITDGSSKIYLRGCFSHALAKRIENTLGDGTEVYGAVRFVLGIPGTCWGLGVYR